MSTKTKPKPRVMWANYFPKFVGAPSIYPDKERAEQGAGGCTTPIRVAVIPLDDVEALVERAATAFLNHDSALNYGRIRAALTAAGIPCKQRRARK